MTEWCFKGALGPWYNDETGDYHLSYAAAKALGELAIKSYTKKAGGPPKEMFIHGKVRFEPNEWQGFMDAAGTGTNIVGVRIQEEKNLKLYRKGQNPVLRGLGKYPQPAQRPSLDARLDTAHSNLPRAGGSQSADHRNQ